MKLQPKFQHFCKTCTHCNICTKNAYTEDDKTALPAMPDMCPLFHPKPIGNINTDCCPEHMLAGKDRHFEITPQHHNTVNTELCEIYVVQYNRKPEIDCDPDGYTVDHRNMGFPYHRAYCLTSDETTRQIMLRYAIECDIANHKSKTENWSNPMCDYYVIPSQEAVTLIGIPHDPNHRQDALRREYYLRPVQDHEFNQYTELSDCVRRMRIAASRKLAATTPDIPVTTIYAKRLPYRTENTVALYYGEHPVHVSSSGTSILKNLYDSINSIYIPACPYGYTGCIHDPAYLLNTDPETYRELYGNKLPFEVQQEEQGEGCLAHFRKHPNKCNCWDDEDK